MNAVWPVIGASDRLDVDMDEPVDPDGPTRWARSACWQHHELQRKLNEKSMMCLTCLIALGGDRDDDRPGVFADYGYFSGDSTLLLVAKDRRTGMTFAAAVSMKGGGDPHAARLLVKWIDGLGCQEVTVRTDGEPGICELIRRVRELPAQGTTSPPGDSAGNRIAEGAISTVGGLVRATKAVVEESVLEATMLAHV